MKSHRQILSLVGVFFLVRANQAPEGASWTAAKVRWCVEADGQCELGCEFTEPPPTGVLLQFG